MTQDDQTVTRSSDRESTTTTVPQWKLPGDSEWTSLDNSSRNTDSVHEYLKRALQMQNVIVLAGSGTSLGEVGGPSMGDLWSACTEISSFSKVTSVLKFDTENSQNIEELLSSAESYRQVFPNDAEDITSFISEAKTIILEKCRDFLTSGDTVLSAHEIFLKKLAARRPYAPRVKLFTTNYDLCFETAASVLGQIVIDGFSFTSPRVYDPRYFDYDILRGYSSVDGAPVLQEGVIRLYKLHGSVNWARQNEQVQINDTCSAEDACIIYPAKQKYQQSYIQPHLELISQYLSSLRQPETCVLVVGFGLNDNHLSEPLIGAIHANPRARFIFVSPSLSDEQALHDHEHLSRVLEAQKSGSDVGFISGTFEDFTRLLPDLTALSPDEQLINAVRRVAKDAANVSK